MYFCAKNQQSNLCISFSYRYSLIHFIVSFFTSNSHKSTQSMLKMYLIGINYQQFFIYMASSKLHSSAKVKDSIQLLKYLMTNTFLTQPRSRASISLIHAEQEHVQHVLEKSLQGVLINLIRVSWMMTN